MSLKKHTRMGIAALCALTLTAVACGDDKKDDGKTGTDKPTLKSGGTLKLAGLRDLTHLDTNQAYEVRAWGFVLRAATRQMYSYENTTDPERRDTPVPDLADGAVKISDDGLTYTFKIKSGVKYAPPISKEIVAADFVRGIKRLCDPNGVSGGLPYFTDTIKGFTEYCDKFSKVKKEDVPATKAFVEGTEVEGLKANGEKELVITLKQKAGDFINMMAVPFTTPVPVEVLSYLTDSAELRQHFPASGPYKLAAYVAKQKIHLDRNVNWDPKTDSLRKAYVDRIEIQTNASGPESIQQQVEAGSLDMYFRGNPPNTAQDKAERAKDPRFHIDKDGSCNFYIAFNLNHTSAGGKLLQKKEVRQALNYAIDKTAILQVLGGPRNGEVQGQILTPVLLGYKKINPYETPGNKGDIEKAKGMLSTAGVPAGTKLDMIYDNTENNKKIVGVVTDTLKKLGITVNGIPKEDATVDTTSPTSDNWDMYYAGWCPDWPGNGARTFFSPLLSDPGLKNYKAGGSYNYGGYDNPEVDTKVTEALAAEPDAAAAIWADIDKQVMDDAPWIPIFASNSLNFVSTRLKGYSYFGFSTSADVTNVSVM